MSKKHFNTVYILLQVNELNQYVHSMATEIKSCNNMEAIQSF